MPRSKLPSPVPDKAAAGRVHDAARFGLVAGIPPGRSYTITSMALKFTTSYLEDSLSLFRHYKKVAEAAMVQVTDQQLVAVLDPEMNCIAAIVKHMAGNMRSRWTDFLTSDGEKPERDRDSEFVEPPSRRNDLMKLWESGWNCCFLCWKHSPGGPQSHGYDPGRSSLSHAGNQPPDCSLLLSLRTDRVPGEALSTFALEVFKRSWPVCQIQSASGGRRSQPAVTIQLNLRMFHRGPDIRLRAGYTSTLCSGGRERSSDHFSRAADR